MHVNVEVGGRPKTLNQRDGAAVGFVGLEPRLGVRTQVMYYRLSNEIGRVAVEPGDLVSGDLDGVVIVPKQVEAEVITQALTKAAGG